MWLRRSFGVSFGTMLAIMVDPVPSPVDQLSIIHPPSPARHRYDRSSDAQAREQQHFPHTVPGRLCLRKLKRRKRERKPSGVAVVVASTTSKPEPRRKPAHATALAFQPRSQHLLPCL